LSLALATFLLAVPALFSIVNPPGAAFIFNEVTAHLTAAQRRMLSDKMALYSLGVMLGALFAGSYILEFFGISLAALRIAGGAVVAVRAFDLLNAPERQEARKAEQAESGEGDVSAMAFFPLTLPFTTGPGTIAVAVALGAQRPRVPADVVWFFAGASAAAVVIAGVIWLSYRSADRIAALLGPSARRTFARLSAFLLLCIGVQIVLAGLADAWRDFGGG
jgi:multiple antibiotic resistance protein